MLSFSIVPAAASDGSSGGYMEIIFSARDDAGAAVAGWTSCWLDVLYLDGTTDGYAILPYEADSHRAIVMSSLGDYPNVFYYRETISQDLETWLTTNLGRTLYFAFYDPATDKDRMKILSATIAFGATLMDRQRTIMDAQTVIKNRLAWIRNDVENVLFPRLKRVLGFCGENLLLDSFGYDAAGNITSLRVRVFDSKTNVEAATEDITDTPETGEIMTLTVEQDHELPRNVRSMHLCSPSSDATDATATENTETDAVNAPGNTGSWPA